jgi:hypothetical protein
MRVVTVAVSMAVTLLEIHPFILMFLACNVT